MQPSRRYSAGAAWTRIARPQGDLEPTQTSSCSPCAPAPSGCTMISGDQTSAVSIKAESHQVVGRLTHVVGQGSSTPQEIKTFARP